MTIEQIELRKILTQMLADNGINRQTITDVVKDIIEEKVNTAINNIIKGSVELSADSLQYLTNQAVKDIVKGTVTREVTSSVRRILNSTSITIEHKPSTLSD